MSQIGWDELLKTRSYVFVMEEEYRMQKAQGDMPPVASVNPVKRGPVIYEDGTVIADDDASTRGVNSNGSALDVASSAGSSIYVPDGIPTIRISTESNRESKLAQEAAVNGAKNLTDTLEKPVQAAAGEAGEGAQEPQSPANTQEPFSFSNKRLCERWLDNLFMVLYEVCLDSSIYISIADGCIFL